MGGKKKSVGLGSIKTDKLHEMLVLNARAAGRTMAVNAILIELNKRKENDRRNIKHTNSTS
jgi:hypothetical protein